MVAETLSRICGPSRSSTCRTTVLLPTPEGPEMTTSFPGLAAIMADEFEAASRESSSRWRAASAASVGRSEAGRVGSGLAASSLQPSASLHVLDLLADSLQGGFDFDDFMRDLRVVRLGADGVRFAAHFLADKL